MVLPKGVHLLYIVLVPKTKVTCLCPCVEGMLAAWVFDECDATGQQRTSAVLFSRAFRPGSAACGGASDAYMPLAASSLQTGKARTAGLNSLLTPPLYGASLVEPALCDAFWDLPPHPPASSEYHRQATQRCHLSSNSLKFVYVKLSAALQPYNDVFSVKYLKLNWVFCVSWYGFC